MTIQYKTVSSRSGQLLAYFNERGTPAFTYTEALKALPRSKEGAVRQLLSDMTKRGLLMRLKEGLFYIVPYDKDPRSFMPDWHLIAEYLTPNVDHYIGYYSALQVHNLITQPSLKEQIVVSKQIRPSIIGIKNVSFQFIYHNREHFFGSKKIWINDFNKVSCSDLEKTLIDCLFKPDYAGGIVEIARAIYASRDKIKFSKLLDDVVRFNSQAVIKRLGFLIEILGIKNDIIDELQRLRSPSYVVLDTELPKTGKRTSRWRVQENLDTETIRTAIFT